MKEVLSRIIQPSFNHAKQLSTKELATQMLFNFVGRDHNQGAFKNGQVQTDPDYLEIATLWDSLNQHGPAHFASFETGGQELGATEMLFRDSGKLLQTLRNALPNGTPLRSLSRSTYGNSVFPLHPEDLKKWYDFVGMQGNGVVFKLFDYNSNFKEMQRALEIVSELGHPIEIAIPHSPEESYQPFFKKKMAEAAPLAAKYGATLSVKRMVCGLDAQDVQSFAPLLFPSVVENGISRVDLHAHGGVPDALAEFLFQASQYGVAKSGVDIVHKGSGGSVDAPGTFPNIYDVCEGLARRGVSIGLTEKQIKILQEIDRIYQVRDKSYQAIRTGGSFTTEAKLAMGMPDGGEAYSVEAINNAGITEKLGVDQEKAFELFAEFYKKFRRDFGMPTSVTPGHKRIEEGAIVAVLNAIPLISGIGTKDITEVMKEAEQIDMHVLYKGMNPATVDAFRNNKLPSPLSEAALEFLCQTHMRTVLSRKEFADLDISLKQSLINSATSKAQVQLLLQAEIDAGNLPEDLIADSGEDMRFAMSLVQAAGERSYTEGAGAEERYPSYVEQIEALREKGTPIANVREAAIRALAAGTVQYVDIGARMGGAPSAADMSLEEYQEAMAGFMQRGMAPVAKRFAADPTKLTPDLVASVICEESADAIMGRWTKKVSEEEDQSRVAAR